ncbi:MAG: PEP-CTERM system TPR-repeat protein PrsT [Acetobacteraceae bacterium]|nr:PEP-CTERM system TPR-repeat protein PrsT [Acetobacteraceae bacterium]
MKKLLILVMVLMVLGAGSGAAWWKFVHRSDNFATARALIEKGDLRAAQIDLRNAVRDDPTNAEAHFRLGVVQMRLGDPVAAEKELRLARDNGFDPRAVTPLLAQTYMAQGKFKELLRDFAASGQPPEIAVAILVTRGLAMMQMDNIDGAASAFAEAERLGPQSVDPPLAAARVLIAKRDYAGAEAKVDRALTINGKAPDALVLKAQLSNLKGDRPKALTALDAAIEVAPNSSSARLERANILVATGQDVKAKADVDFVLNNEPRSAGAVYLQAVLAARAKDFPAADAALTKITGVMSRFPRGYYFQAIVKFNLGQAEQAVEAAGKYVARNPGDPDGIKLMARIDLAVQRPEHAIQMLEAPADAGTADADMLDLLGRAYAQSGRSQQALTTLQKAAAMAPDNADILNRLASARLGLGDAAGAAKDLEHSLELAPKQASTGEALVVASLADGDVDKAAAALTKLDQSKVNAEVFGILTGMVRMAQLDVDAAVTAFRSVLKERPDSVPARLNLAKIAMLRNQIPDAERLLSEILSQLPANEQALSALVGLYVLDGRLPRAVVALQAARAAAPTNIGVTLGLIDLHIRLRDGDKALAIIDEAMKGQAQNQALVAAKVRALVSLGKNADAETELRNVLKTDPTNEAARRTLADLLGTQKMFDPSRATLRDGLALVPGSPRMIEALIALELVATGPDRTLQLLDELSRDTRNRPALRAMKGNVLMTANKFADAAAAYAAEYKIEPSGDLAARTAQAWGLAGKPDLGRPTLVEWLATHPDDMAPLQVLITMDIGAKKYDDAERSLKKVLDIQPNNVPALNNLAWIYQQKGDTMAQTLAHKAYLLSPTPQVADTLGWILVSQGKPDVALMLLRQASTQLATDGTVQFHYAFALNAVGKKDEAVSVLRPIVLGKAEFDEKPAAKRMFDELSVPK